MSALRRPEPRGPAPEPGGAAPEAVADRLGRRLAGRGWLVVDGGLATALEARGHDLSTALWSARLLIEQPDEIRAVHAAYLEAGADVLVTSSYQATPEGLRHAGVDEGAAPAVLTSSTRLASEAVDAFEAGASGSGVPIPTGTARRPRPLVAASVGPYGASLADGSEYHGRYNLSAGALVDFHAERFRLLAASGADLLACETIPSVVEVEALVRLLDDTPDARCWLSFTCRDGRSLRDGTPVEEAARLAGAHDRVVAVGFNCTEPGFAGELAERIGAASGRPVVAYPNSGERWDGRRKRWLAGDAAGTSWLEGVEAAWRSGARIVGGCCRTGPGDIAELRRCVARGDWDT